MSDYQLHMASEKSDKELGFSILARSPFIECVTKEFSDNEQFGILRTWPNSSPCFMSQCNAIHPICHSATRMKKTNSTNISTQCWDLDDMFLRICILFVVGLDTAVGSAFGNLLIVCACGFSMRLRFCNHLEEPLVH